MNAQENLIRIAKSYVGYIEKKSNKDLDDFTANAGMNNYTSFARDYKTASGINAQAQPWCDVFVDMMFIYTFGAEKAKTMLGGFSAYTPESANYFKKMGRFFKKPALGDVIFFKNSQRIYHTGIVYAVDGDMVYSIEGNTSPAKGVVENGGCVAKKSYSLDYSKIAGYGRPVWEIAESEELNMAQYEELKNLIDKQREEIAALTAKCEQLSNTVESTFIFNYNDENVPEWAREALTAAMNSGAIKGDENGKLGLNYKDLRTIVREYRCGMFG